MLYREPKLLKDTVVVTNTARYAVSVLYREPKLLKGGMTYEDVVAVLGFSALP